MPSQTQQDYNYQPRRHDVRPNYAPDYTESLIKGLSAYSSIKGAQASDKRLEMLAGTEKQKAEMDRLATSENPEERKLYGQLNPQGALAQEKLQAQRDQDFLKGVAGSYLMLEGSSQEEKAKFWAERDAGIKEKGLKAGRIEKLANLYNDGSEESAALADKRAKGYYRKAVAMGLIEPPRGQKPLAIERKMALLEDPNYPQWKKDIVNSEIAGQQFNVETGPDGFVKVSVGKGAKGKGSEGLQKKTKADIEGNLLKLSAQLAETRANRKLFQEDFHTYQGAASAAWTNFKSKVKMDYTPEEAEFATARKVYTLGVERGWNIYRKEITGAAAAVKELHELKKAAVNMDLGPLEAKAAYTAYEAGLLRAQRVYRKAAREGRGGSFTDKNSASAKLMNSLWISGGDDDTNDRLEDFPEDMNDKEVFQIMRNEGYTF